MPNPFFESDNPGLVTEEVANLIVRPLEAESVALRVASTVAAHESALRVPSLTSDAQAVWADEGDDLTVDGPTTQEQTIGFSKVGAVVPVSSELQEDSTPQAAELVGQSIARRIARKIDHAFFGTDPAPAPSGLGALAGVKVIAVGAVTNLDSFVTAVFTAAAENSAITSFVMNPGDLLTLAKLKDESGSNRALLTVDASGTYRVAGVPLVPSADLALGVVWAIPKALTIVAVRRDIRLEVSDQVFFSTDKIGVKVTMRVGFAFPAPEGLVKLTVTGGVPLTGSSNS